MKIIEKGNFRVEVYPQTTAYGIKVSEEKDVCQSILNDIKRHVNDVQHAHIVYDEIARCSYCFDRWTEDGDTYNGGCCEADQAASGRDS